jgi:hypothetical protein
VETKGISHTTSEKTEDASRSEAVNENHEGKEVEEANTSAQATKGPSKSLKTGRHNIGFGTVIKSFLS